MNHILSEFGEHVIEISHHWSTLEFDQNYGLKINLHYGGAAKKFI